ncbi:hypothetical protein DPMN_119547 [Dreissena polymorpha]|uniref:Uncharacterized protein n=1 Tax=Dreissena polymorpha TaxID=45954 RepID=A0A9D4GJG2_DREPO|nr:hypothetical protein DPMN_119547 [Dreissena polymorpha]
MARQRQTRLVMGPCIIEIDQVNRCRNEEVIVKGKFGLVWPMWAGRPSEDRPIVIGEVQYQLELKAFFGGCDLCGWGAPGLVMGPCIVKIDRIVIREFQGSCANRDKQMNRRRR